MDNLYIALPINLFAHVKSSKHTKNIFDTFENYKSSIANEVKAVISSESSQDAIVKLHRKVQQHMTRLWMIKDGHMDLSDFAYSYVVESSNEEGEFWSGILGSSTKNVSEIL